MAKKQVTEIVSWEEEMAALAIEAASTEATNLTGGTFLSAQGGVFSYKDSKIGTEIEVIVLDHTIENHYYEDDYDSDTPSIPVCFSFSKQEDGMVPHEYSTQAQHSDCATCPNNQFGSARRGKGKACKNVRRLALILAESAGNVGEAEVAYLKIPVTSVKAWGSYVQQIAGVLKRPPLGVVTTITIVPDEKTQFKMIFKVIEKISDGALIRQLIDKKGVILEDLVRPYEQIEIVEKPKKASKRKF